MNIISCGKTDKGLVRENNEDNFLVDNEVNLFVVCDGMGGHKSGEVASKIAVDVIKENVRKALMGNGFLFGKFDEKYSKAGNCLLSSIKFSNQLIYEASQNYPQDYGMGTTSVGIIVMGDVVSIANVGDSRAYLVREGSIKQITKDHSLVADQVSKGLITEEEAEKSAMKNILTRAVGAKEDVDVDIDEFIGLDNDYLLLCSDGLTRMVSDSKIRDNILEFKEPELICDKLIQSAIDAGARDNVTVVVVKLNKETAEKKCIFSKIKGFFVKDKKEEKEEKPFSPDETTKM